VDLVIDYEHQSLQGDRAPAAGWIKELEARADGLWARVEWTPQAREHLLKREYRYFSPVLRLDPETRKPLSLMHLGLTNVPAIKHLPPLVAKQEDGEVLAAETQTLKIDAGEGAVIEAARRQELATALELPEEASWPEIVGVVQALKAGAAGAGDLRQEVAALKSRLLEEKASRAVDESMKAGKVTPAQKEWALEYCRRDPEGFQAYVRRAPKVIPVGEELRFNRREAVVREGLLPEELALCRALKVKPEEYLKAKGGKEGLRA
jgi:phage I-like protein